MIHWPNTKHNKFKFGLYSVTVFFLHAAAEKLPFHRCAMKVNYSKMTQINEFMWTELAGSIQKKERENQFYRHWNCAVLKPHSMVYEMEKHFEKHGDFRL